MSVIRSNIQQVLTLLQGTADVFPAPVTARSVGNLFVPQVARNAQQPQAGGGTIAENSFLCRQGWYHAQGVKRE